MLGYLVSQLSENIGETPEGFLICRDAVIGRTGFQTYKGAELLREHGADGLAKLGLDNVRPDDDVKVFRPQDEVYAADTIKSFEGKPFVDNHPPGGQFVTPDNIDLYQRGHVQNVRKGTEPLDSGDWPLLGDIVITHPDVQSKVRNGERELSCGYGYDLARNNGHIIQTNIVGNHVALVPKGRAGSDARINDSAPDAAPAEVAKVAKPQPTPIAKKEAYHVTNLLKHVFGLGLKAFAQDAEPEKLAEAAEEAKKLESKSPSAEDRKSDDRHADDRHAEDRKAEDAKAADGDRRADDRGARLHAALDRVLQHHADKRAAEDVDLEELKGLMGQYFEEEKGEGEHADAGDAADIAPTDVTDPSTQGTDAAADAADGDKAKADDAADGEPLVATFGSTTRKREPSAHAMDAVGGAAFVLKALKPHIAKAAQLARAGKGDAAAKHLYRAFDTIATSVNETAGRAGAGMGYADFAKAASERSDDARRSMARAADSAKDETPAEHVAKLNETMRSRFRVSVTEVKK